MPKCPEDSNSRSLIRAPPLETSTPEDDEEATVSREWSQIDLLGHGSSHKNSTSVSPFRGRRKKRMKPAKFTDAEKEFYQGKTTEERGNEKSVSPLHPVPGANTTSRGTSRSGYTPARDHMDVAVLVPAERFQRLRPRLTSPGTVEYLAMRLERLKVEPSRNILELIILRRPIQMARSSNK